MSTTFETLDTHLGRGLDGISRFVVVGSALLAMAGGTAVLAATFTRTLDLAGDNQRPAPVPAALFGANIGYWSKVNDASLAAAAQEAGLTVFRFHPGTYNDPSTPLLHPADRLCLEQRLPLTRSAPRLPAHRPGNLPRIHVTELNWAEYESVPFTTTVDNAVNLACSYGDALDNDVNNLCWFTFTSGAANYNASFTNGWRKYHNWGLIADDPLAGKNPNFSALTSPGMFAGVRFPVFHAYALLKEFVRRGDRTFLTSALQTGLTAPSSGWSYRTFRAVPPVDASTPKIFLRTSVEATPCPLPYHDQPGNPIQPHAIEINRSQVDVYSNNRLTENTWGILILRQCDDVLATRPIAIRDSASYSWCEKKIQRSTLKKLT